MTLARVVETDNYFIFVCEIMKHVLDNVEDNVSVNNFYLLDYYKS